VSRPLPPPFVRFAWAALAGAVVVIGLSAQARPASPPAPATQSAAGRITPQPSNVTSPKEQWGHDVGDDYFLATYQQAWDYWHLLEKQSPRLHVAEIGRTSENRPMMMAIITSPANYAKLDRYREISRRLSLVDGLTDADAHALAREGKAVVWIDGGLHANEVLGAQQLLELVYEMVSRDDEETRRLLDDVILLCAIANPDGMEQVSDWYMRHGTVAVPVLYQKYAGHDNNRDFYLSALAETTNINRVLDREWFPQIVYDHHQTGPDGTVMFAPPFRDPFNYHLHPAIPAGIDVVGSMMAQRFIAEGKPGVTSRAGSTYSSWWNGGLRTTAYFHNQIGILTETIGGPDPTSVPFVATRQIGDSNLWFPIRPQDRWHFRQSIDYSLVADRSVLDYASRYREVNLFNVYRMGKDEVQWGSEDHWTFTPHEVAQLQQALGLDPSRAVGRAVGARPTQDPLYRALTSRQARDPRGFILPSTQPDVATATKFVNALIKSGVKVLRATAPFVVNARSYAAGSFVVKTDQPFRPHVLDMFEPQDYPDDIPYPGAPPRRPYDNAGYTLAMQMGVEFDRVFEGFSGPFETLTDLARVPAGTVPATPAAAGYYFSHRANDSMTTVNRLLKAGESVSWMASGPLGPGTFYVVARPSTLPVLKAAADLGVSFDAAASAPLLPMTRLQAPRIGLFDTYGGNVSSGWTRLILESFEFPYQVVFPPDLDAGGLHAKYDVLVFNGAGVPVGGRGDGGGAVTAARGPGRAGFTPEPIPAAFARRAGQMSVAAMERVREFVRDGGTVIYIGGVALAAAQHFGLPVTSQLSGVPAEKFYVPGSILRVAVDNSQPAAHGLGDAVDVFFDDDPVFKLEADAASKGVKAVAWFANGTPLRSGWAWGAAYLDKGVEVVDAKVGKGHVLLCAPEITFRAQSHGTFKFLLNGLYRGQIE
jgi:hypothetical protein